ncbi:hypothetical protein [Dactylosporangium darangshiense]|uniref:hypothetical protein n=1 Tax=Dactylosporangium darangshiense TaxID=579108 RepID=UPI0036328CA2
MARTRRGRIVDLACVVACLALGALLLRFGDAGWSRPAAPATPPWPVDAAVGAACGLLMWYRDRWPLPVALAVVPAGAFAGSATPALALAVFTVAVHRPAREAILVALADVASVVVYFALQADPRHPSPSTWPSAAPSWPARSAGACSRERSAAWSPPCASAPPAWRPSRRCGSSRRA